MYTVYSPRYDYCVDSGDEYLTQRYVFIFQNELSMKTGEITDLSLQLQKVKVPGMMGPNKAQYNIRQQVPVQASNQVLHEGIGREHNNRVWMKKISTEQQFFPVLWKCSSVHKACLLDERLSRDVYWGMNYVYLGLYT